jgi:hypothetical protein
MEVVPAAVGAVSRSWDEQHLDLAAAATQVAGAPTAGFTPAVQGAATRFLAAWERHCDGLGDDAETRADALRAVIRDVVGSDRAVADEVETLREYVEEVR